MCICFFRLKTAYEVGISDWSSDVCSSDLCHRLGMEVAAGNNLVGLAVPSRKYQGVVGYRVGLDQQGARRLPQQIVHGSHHLGLAAQAVRVLHLAIVKYMGAAYLAAGQQTEIQPGVMNLAGLEIERAHV